MLPAQNILQRARAARYAGGGEVDPAGVHLTARPMYDRYREEAMVSGQEPLSYEEWGQQQTAQAVASAAAQARAAQAAQQAQAQAQAQGPGGVDPGRLAMLRKLLMSRRVPIDAATPIPGRAAGGPVTGMMGPLASGDSAQHMDALRQLLSQLGGGGSMTPHFAEGGGIHHVEPGSNDGFTHEDNGVYMYADGGMVAPPPGMPMGPRPMAMGPHPGMPMGVPRPAMMGPQPNAPVPGTAAPIGALAQMGQQLLEQQKALGQVYNIPAGTPAPMSTPGGGPPAGGVGLPSPGGGAAGTVPPAPGMMAALQNKLGPPRLAAGGLISGGMMKMALRAPHMLRKYCGGGMIQHYAAGGIVGKGLRAAGEELPAAAAHLSEKFSTWLGDLRALIAQRSTLTPHDLHDVNYNELFLDGHTPKSAADMILEHGEEGNW